MAWNMKMDSILTLAGALLLAACGGCIRTPMLKAPEPPAVNPGEALTDAMVVLRQEAESSDPVIRSNALEALAETAGAREGGLYLQALGDANPLVQFAAAMAIGETRYAPALPALKKIAGAEGPDKRVYAGAVHALHRLGDDEAMPDLGRLLFHREAEVRAVTAMVLGKIGEPSAIGPLRSLLDDEKDAKVEVQAVESLAMLGDPYGRTVLEGYTRRPFLDDRLVAIPAMARVRPERAIIVLEGLQGSKEPMPVRVAVAGALARLGQRSDYNFRLCAAAVDQPEWLLQAAYGKDREIAPGEVDLVRRLGAISLGWMNRPDAVNVLFPVLKSPEPSARVAAAMSIVRLRPRQESAALAPRAETPVAAPTGGPVGPRLETSGGKD